MSDAARLLRMLEPAVRPVAPPGAAQPPKHLPLDQQDFSALLEEARTQSATPDDAQEPIRENKPAGTSVADPLKALGAPDQLENASLRQLLAQRNAPNDSMPHVA
jgi:hypothetical protein